MRNKVDEATGLCPNCDADKIKERSVQEEAIVTVEQKQDVVQVPEEPLSKKEAKKKRNEQN